jgi:hypothetical protein
MWLLSRFLGHRPGARYRKVVETPVPEETRLRIRREAEEGTRPVIRLRRTEGGRYMLDSSQDD